ncbi:hypothetical protein [Sphingobacterium bambusae]|uniref:YcxB-like protein domain-containing protein n=1 Tax=Sphingobacterium bambusae TaxID=662858 RepID=A0ABW6BKG4_9SPHI|nr:hypothetical protein [Sphingobacterium bambusae]WPL49046.1 hypothetical protein SCB77_01030 [Sphingobacterium bambusae]
MKWKKLWNMIKDRYQLVETATSFSFRPFYHYKKRLKWYLSLILIVAGYLFIEFPRLSETLLIIGVTVLLLSLYFFMKEMVLIPITYIFEQSQRMVYRRFSPCSQQEIMPFDDIVILRSSAHGVWHYATGRKRRQFLKNYAISENFNDSNKKETRRIAFEREILDKIENLISSNP